MAIALRYAARSDVGLVRKNNQDSAYAGPHLLVVADGMGGHAGGDVASSIAVGELAGLDGESHGSDALGHLEQSVHRAHTLLQRRVEEEPDLAGMGTTLTALLRSGGKFALVHIGDSRAYLVRDGEMAQVTTDHTYVQRLVDEALDVRVVGGDLGHLAVAHQVGTRVADVHQRELAAGSEQRRERGPHPRQVGLLLHPSLQQGVGAVHRLLEVTERVGAVGLAVQTRELPDRDRRGDITAGVAPMPSATTSRCGPA